MTRPAVSARKDLLSVLNQTRRKTAAEVSATRITTFRSTRDGSMGTEKLEGGRVGFDVAKFHAQGQDEDAKGLAELSSAVHRMNCRSHTNNTLSDSVGSWIKAERIR